ncbi:MAG: hypothetical protein ACOY32_10695 [Thermodesulfobacteriota bacterium]
MKKILLALLALPSAALSPAAAEAQERAAREIPTAVRFDVRQEVYIYNVSGNDEMSTLSAGDYYNTSVNWAARKIYADTSRFEFFTNVRMTDDFSLEPSHGEDPHILRFLTRYSKPDHYEFSLGDIYANYSSYALSRSLEGLSYWHWFDGDRQGEETLHLDTANFTLARVHEERGQTQYDRHAGAGRLGAQYGDNWSLLLDLARTWDDENSNRSALVSPIDNWVWSLHGAVEDLSWGYLRYLNARFELGYSTLDPDTSTSSGSELNDYACKFTMAGRLARSRWGLSYEYIKPDFYSAVGSASPDSQLVRGYGRLPVLPWLTARLDYRQYRDNLDGQLNTTTKSRAPGLSFDILNIPALTALHPKWRGLSFRVGSAFNTTEANDNSIDRLRSIYSIAANYFIRQFNIGLEYAFTDMDDDIAPTSSYHQNATGVNISWSGVRINDMMRISPLLSSTYNRQKSDTTLNSYWSHYLALNSTIGRTTRLNLRYDVRQLDTETKRELEIDMEASIANDYLLEEATSADTDSNGLSAELIHRLEKLGGAEISVLYNRRANSFDYDRRDYDEEIFLATLRIPLW